MNYEEAMEYLQGLTRFGINLGLSRIEELLARLGDPHRKGLKIIHIGGTNGKGSTTAMLAGILRAAGYRVGAFTSPHLHSYTERYTINGIEIEQVEIAALLTELRPHLDEMVAAGHECPTEFEVGTALAFLYFFREKVDYLLLEVGLGGAIDSTNVALPLLAVITNVAKDHLNYLGHTIREIATVKAGIIKPGIPVVTAATGTGLQVVEQVSSDKGCPLTRVGQDITWAPEAHSISGQHFSIWGQKGSYEGLEIRLLGRHQLVNAATAIGVVEGLIEKGAQIDKEEIRGGLAAASIPGRLEITSLQPLTIIDGAHNYAGARSLKSALADYFPDRDIVLVIGMLDDKERGHVVDVLVPGAKAVVVTKPDSPRSGDWRHLAGLAGRHTANIYLSADVGEALDQARNLTGPEDLLCITGSIYLVAEARGKLLTVGHKDLN